MAVDPPPSGVSNLNIKCSILPMLPLDNLSASCGKLYLSNLTIPDQFFRDAGITYKSPFGHKFVIPLHTMNELAATQSQWIASQWITMMMTSLCPTIHKHGLRRTSRSINQFDSHLQLLQTNVKNQRTKFARNQQQPNILIFPLIAQQIQMNKNEYIYIFDWNRKFGAFSFIDSCECVVHRFAI